MGDEPEDTRDRWRAWAQGLPRAHQHHYWHENANEPIGLYRGGLRVTTKASRKEFGAEGTVALQWLPTPRIVYRAEASLDPIEFFSLIDEDVVVSLPEPLPDHVPGPFQVESQVSGANAKGDTLSGSESILEFGKPEEVTRIRFGLVNFPECIGTFVRADDHPYRGRLTLSASGWLVVIDQRKDHEEALQQLKTTGGYALTHVGELTRPEQASFSLSVAKHFLEGLHYFFSFALGAWTGPILPVGYDVRGKPVWSQWASPVLDPWSASMTWFDRYHSGQLVELLPLFMEKWHDSYWRDVIRRAVQWYRDANQPTPVQRALALAQIILELLAFAILVEDRQKLSEAKYYNQKAGLVFAQLLDELGIPIDIPSELSALTKVAKQEQWSTGPHAVAALRNKVIHPKREMPQYDFQVWIEAWNLMSWYAELSLLSFLGYNGVYNSRLKRDRSTGLVEPVPWYHP